VLVVVALLPLSGCMASTPANMRDAQAAWPD